MNASANIATHLVDMARLNPTLCAYHVGKTGERGDFASLNQWSDRIACGLNSIGIVPGQRIALMQPPGPTFMALTFALFKLGAIPEFIDPGMGLRGVGRCLAEARPVAFVGVLKAHVARMLGGWAKSAHTLVHTGRFGPGYSLRHIERLGEKSDHPILVEPEPNELAAILFTSGSTGPAKGVVYTHAMFQAQIAALKSSFGIQLGEVDLCTFPLFALFAPALGMTSIVPDMNPSRPAKASPGMLVHLIQKHRVTNLFGSPALIKNLAEYCDHASIQLPTLNRVISAGAPVSAQIVERMTKCLAEGVEVFTPYGATESLPVAIIGSNEILSETRQRTEDGAGICVGRPAGHVQIAIIDISDEPIAEWSAANQLGTNQIGEIVVRGPVVSPSYFRLPDATMLAKIPDPAKGTFWHRMGDVGYFDDSGRLWYCGRKSQRVATKNGTLFTAPCEEKICHHINVNRTALVGVAGQPVLCVESTHRLSKTEQENTRRALLEESNRSDQTRMIRDILFYPKQFPVDIRHNAKINREQLADWAAKKLQ